MLPRVGRGTIRVLLSSHGLKPWWEKMCCVERRGTANVFGVVEPKAGRHFTFATPDRSGSEQDTEAARRRRQLWHNQTRRIDPARTRAGVVALPA